MPETLLLERLEDVSRAVARADLHRRHGRVSDLIGLIVEATGLEAEVGEVCEVRTGRDANTGGYTTIPAEVVGFRSGRTLLMPLGEMHGIGPGDVVTATGRRVSVATGPELLGVRETAAVASAVTGKRIEVVQGGADTRAGFGRPAMSFTTSHFEQLTGRKPTSLRTLFEASKTALLTPPAPR